MKSTNGWHNVQRCSFFAKICEWTSLSPPAGSSAFFSGDVDGGVPALTRTKTFALADVSRLIQAVTTVACLPSIVIREFALVNKYSDGAMYQIMYPCPQLRHIWRRCHCDATLKLGTGASKELESTKWAKCQPLTSPIPTSSFSMS